MKQAHVPGKYTPDIKSFSGKSCIDLGATMSWGRCDTEMKRNRNGKLNIFQIS